MMSEMPFFTDSGVMPWRSEEHTSELQSPYVISYAVFCLKKKISRACLCSLDRALLLLIVERLRRARNALAYGVPALLAGSVELVEECAGDRRDQGAFPTRRSSV